MTISGLGTYNSSSYHYKSTTRSRSGSLSNVPDNFKTKDVSNDNLPVDLAKAARKAVENSPYCKVIMAKIQTEELYASENDLGEMVYSYEKTERSFQIFIKSDGHDKTYSVKGYDKDGNLFEKDINPEDVDPEYADFPEFSALCMYFEHTEQTAEFLEDDYFDTDDLLEKMNYLEKLNDFRTDGVLDRAKRVMDYANRLFNDFHQMMNARDDIQSLFEPYFMKFVSTEITQIDQSEVPEISDSMLEVHSSEKFQEEKAEDEHVTPLGFGFANAGKMGYGMSASLVTKPGSDDTIIRVKVATGSGDEVIDVNLSEFDPKNATPVEMFAYCQYKDAIGEGVSSKWGSWNALKSVMSPTDGADFGSLENIMNKKMNWTDSLAKSKTSLENPRTGQTLSASDLIKMFEESHELTSQELKEDKDWREMSDDEWDNLLEGIDKYIESFKERIRQLKEIQEEAIKKAAMEASADMEKEVMSKYEEVMLTDETTVGVTSSKGVTECASVEEDENKEKVWTITAFTEQGIVSNKCQNGEIISSWEIKYNNLDDEKRVEDFINSFAKDADLKFSGSKEFWEMFLSDNLTADSMYAAHEAAFENAGPKAPARVPAIAKIAWMDAAKETGYLEGGKMNHISQLLIRQVENREKGIENYQNVFGESVASVLQAAREILYDLENPLTPNSSRSEEARAYTEQEKEFYKKFIEKLEEISGILVGDETNMHIDSEKAEKYSSKLRPVENAMEPLQ